MDMEPIDWQNSCLDMKSRGKYLLETEKWSDCRFLVGIEPNQQILAGHKLILAMASPVFERMFYGNLPDKTDPILIPDVQPDAFRAMMEYIYSDKVNITSFDKACELCYVAKKYILPSVVEQCTSYLWSDLSPKNACRAYEFAKLFEEPRLMQRCLQIISTKTLEVLNDASFAEVELSTLLTIFDQDQLNIDSELDLFNALNKHTIDRGIYALIPAPVHITVDVDVVTNSPPTEQNQNNQTLPTISTEPPFSPNRPIVLEGIIPGTSRSTTPAANPLGEGPSKPNQIADGNNSDLTENNEDIKEAEDRRMLDEMVIKEAAKKIRFLTLTPQQFAEGPARSALLSQSESLAIFINISSPAINDCPMPEGFCKSRMRRNCMIRCDESSQPFFARHEDYGYSPPALDIRTPPFSMGGAGYLNFSGLGQTHHFEPDVLSATMETRKFYCIRTIRQQIDYRNTSVTDCGLTLTVDTNILITGVQVPTQVLCGELMNSAGFTERYSEILYAHILDAQGSRLTYTHCTPRVRYDSLLEISFDRPVFIHRNKLYKIGVVFNKVGWYPMYTCFPEVDCANVHFMFNTNHESLRDGLIKAIVFTHPVAPQGSSHSYAMLDNPDI